MKPQTRSRTLSALLLGILVSLPMVAGSALAAGGREGAKTSEGTARTGKSLLSSSERRASGQKARTEIRGLRARMTDRRTTLRLQAADPNIREVMKHSQTDGSYYMMSDLHWGYGRETPNGPLHRQE